MIVNLCKQFVGAKGEPAFVTVAKTDENGDIVYRKDVNGVILHDRNGNPLPEVDKRPEIIKDTIALSLFNAKKEGKDALIQFTLTNKVANATDKLEISIDEAKLIKDVIEKAGYSAGVEAQILMALNAAV